MISERELLTALDSYLQTVPGAGTTWPVFWPGVPFTAPNGIWLAVQLLTRQSRPLSLGVGGIEEDSGTYQILVTGPAGKGPYALADVADIIKPFYRRGFGTTLTSGWKLRFDKTDVRPPYGDGPWLRLPLLVPFTVYAPG